MVPMNFHFTTTKAHIELAGGRIAELFTDEALKIKSDHPFKGNIDIAKLKALIARQGKENVPYIRMEAGTNLIGGQPFSTGSRRPARAPPAPRVSCRATSRLTPVSRPVSRPRRTRVPSLTKNRTISTSPSPP